MQKVHNNHDVEWHGKVWRRHEKSGSDAGGIHMEQGGFYIRNHNIDCSFAFCSSYLYSRMDGTRLEEEEETAKKIGIDAFLTEKTGLPFPVEDAMGFPRQAN